MVQARYFFQRVNKQYRIEFTVKDNGIEPLITVCNILELSNHLNKKDMITIPGVDPNMIVSNIEPAHTTHPGEVLKNKIEYRGISQKKFAEQIGVQYTVLNEILNCKRPVNVQFAMLVEAALGIDADFWVKMQTRYNMLTAKRNKTFSKRLAEIRKVAALL